MRFCIQNAVNTMEMKDSGQETGDHTIGGGLRDRRPGSYIYIYIYIYTSIHTYIYINMYIYI